MPDVQKVAEHEPLVPDALAVSAPFAREGFVVLRALVDGRQCDAMAETARRHLSPLIAPVEFEADVGYPGAPSARDGQGGDTPRRLLGAFARDQAFRAFALGPDLHDMLRQLLGKDVMLSQCHHNCVMTKHPGYSSATSWHQDSRYWSFDRPELVSAWLALGDETRANGALQVIPGSHRLDLPPSRVDKSLFLRRDVAENRALMDQAVTVELSKGDVLLFSSRLFHAAGPNDTDTVKLSVVFTYHAASNRPTPGTRSAQAPSVALAP